MPSFGSPIAAGRSFVKMICMRQSKTLRIGNVGLGDSKNSVLPIKRSDSLQVNLFAVPRQVGSASVLPKAEAI